MILFYLQKDYHNNLFSHIMTFKHFKLLFIITVYYFLENIHSCDNHERPTRIIQYTRNTKLANLLSDSVLLLGNKNFKNTNLVNIFVPLKNSSEVMFEIIDKTIKKLSNWSLLIRDSFCPNVSVNFECKNNQFEENLESPDVYIYPLQGQNDYKLFDAQVEANHLEESFNPKAVFILLKMTSKCGLYNKQQVLVHFFSKLWKYNCMSAVMLVLSKCDQYLTFVTAKPFSPENTCRKPKVSGIQCLDFSTQNSTEQYKIRKSEPTEFNGCNFVAATVPYEPYVIGRPGLKLNDKDQMTFVGGLEIELVRLLSEELRFNYTFDQSNGFEADAVYKKLPNGTVIGIEPDAMRNKIDFFFTGWGPDPDTFRRLDMSPTYKFSSYSWFVPNAAIEPQWEIVFKTFSTEVWILFVSTFFLVNIAFILLDKKSSIHNQKSIKGRQTLYRKDVIFFELFRISLGAASVMRPKSSFLRILFIAWSIYSLDLTIAYSTSLFGLLRNPPTGREILTIEDLEESELKVAAPAVYIDSIKDLNLSGIAGSVLKNNIKCVTLVFCLRQFIKYRNFSLMDQIEHLEFLVNFKDFRIHKVDQDFFSNGIKLFLTKGSPLTKQLNKLIVRSFQSGLVLHFERKTGWMFNSEKVFETSEEENSLPLGVKDLQGLFLLLFIGYFLSTSVFLVEYFVNLKFKSF